MKDLEDAFDARSTITKNSHELDFQNHNGTLQNTAAQPLVDERISVLSAMRLQFAFDRDLESSRVYRMARKEECDCSFTSSAMRTHALSVFTGLSLADISALSVVALPLYADDLRSVNNYFVDLDQTKHTIRYTENGANTRPPGSSNIYSRPETASSIPFGSERDTSSAIPDVIRRLRSRHELTNLSEGYWTDQPISQPQGALSKRPNMDTGALENLRAVNSTFEDLLDGPLDLFIHIDELATLDVGKEEIEHPAPICQGCKITLEDERAYVVGESEEDILNGDLTAH
jgi:hypothetical protein